MSQSIEELEKRIAVLERKAAREKKARNLAEDQLEKYSLDIYEANQSLKRALDSSEQKQIELEYLGKTSSDVASELPLNEMIANVVELTGKFCSACYGFYLISENGKEVGGKLNETWYLDKGWQASTEHKTFINEILQVDNPTILDSWVFTEIDQPPSEQRPQCCSVFYTNFALASNKVGWLMFVTDQQNYAAESLSVLSTAREHLLSGIRRRLTDVRILKRNVQLQDSINKLENARRQLIQSEKMASLGQLAAGVAHEINNPIAFIRSNMEVLKEYLNDYKTFNSELKNSLEQNQSIDATAFDDISQKVDVAYLEEDSDELLDSNIEGLDRVKEIVDNLKGFSHAGDEVLVEMSLFKCIVAALKIAGNMFKYEHTIVNQVPENCPPVMGNAGQLQQVFVNLFVNAAYAMQGGGQLTVDCKQNKQTLTISVTDTGSGMDEETVKKLFTPFFTTKPVGVGTGLGLSVSYAILEAHEAQLSVESELGIGTTFNLVFPKIL